MSFEIHHRFIDPLHIRVETEPATAILAELHNINQKLTIIMADLAALQKSVADEDTVIDSAVALINGLVAQVAALQPNQADIDKLVADISAKRDALAAAVAAGTPAQPAP